MSYNSNAFIGMPPVANAIPPGDKLSDTQMADPRGDRVNNTVGDNLVDGSTNGGPVNSTRQASGHSLGMYSKPSWLCS